MEINSYADITWLFKERNHNINLIYKTRMNSFIKVFCFLVYYVKKIVNCEDVHEP